jgi:hypothetical protein
VPLTCANLTTATALSLIISHAGYLCCCRHLLALRSYTDELAKSQAHVQDNAFELQRVERTLLGMQVSTHDVMIQSRKRSSRHFGLANPSLIEEALDVRQVALTAAKHEQKPTDLLEQLENEMREAHQHKCDLQVR